MKKILLLAGLILFCTVIPQQKVYAQEAAPVADTGIVTQITGDELTFDPLFYPYYQMLDEKGQHVYRQIVANACAGQAKFAPAESISQKELRNIFQAVVNDHPELFWVDPAYNCKYYRKGTCIEIGLSFNKTADSLQESIAAFHAAAQEYIQAASALQSNYEKEKLVHNMLVDRIEYQRRSSTNQSAYSALVGGKTVCAGYARAFQYIMQQLGIPCYCCTGYAKENHAWNIVYLDDGFYYVDVTFDDTSGGTYLYFNKNEADFAGDHRRQDLSTQLPACNGEKYRNATGEEWIHDPRRSLAETGLDENSIMRTLDEYYVNCLNQILAQGTGDYTFYNIIEGSTLFEQWKQVYSSDIYKDAYLTAAMNAVGASGCRMDFDMESLQGDRYLIAHHISLQ